MKRLLPLVIGVLLAACGDPVAPDGEAPGGGAGSDSEPVSAPTDPASSDVETVSTGADDPSATGATSTSAVPDSTPSESPTTAVEPTDPQPTDPQPSDPPTEPSATETPMPTGVPTDRVVRFFAGGGAPGVPWVPLGHWDGTDWQGLQYADVGILDPLPTSPIASVAATSLDLPDGADAVVTGLTLGDGQPYCSGEEAGPLIDLPTQLPDTAVSLGYDAVAVTADWPLQPRPVRQVGLQVPEYAAIGARLLADQVGTANDGSVVQAVRVDLDGNGVDEVLVTYERQQAGDFGGDGDFTSIYVRYPSSDATVIDELLVAHVSTEPVDFPTPGRYTIAAVADLNGDSVMEVMVRGRFWESGGVQIFALDAGRLTGVASGGCSI